MKQKHQLTLYHYWRSSCSWRVRWALALKGLDYKSVPVNLLKGEHQTPEYATKNPSLSVPTLEIDGRPFSESLAILEWLEEEYPVPALLPEDPQSRLKVRELCLMVVAGTQPIQNLKVQRFVSEDAAVRERFAQHWIREGLKSYEARILKLAGTYSFGGQLTMADLCLIPQCYNAERFNVSLDDVPTVKRIYERCMKTPECDRAAPQNQPGAF